MRKPAQFDNWPAILEVGYGPFRAVVCRQVDGDTYYCLLDVGVNDYPFREIRLLGRDPVTGRPRGIDTPETNRRATKAAGLAAAAYAREHLVPIGTPIILETWPDPDSFGRYLGAMRLADGRDVGHELVEAGHAVWRDYD